MVATGERKNNMINVLDDSPNTARIICLRGMLFHLENPPYKLFKNPYTDPWVDIDFDIANHIPNAIDIQSKNRYNALAGALAATRVNLPGTDLAGPTVNGLVSYLENWDGMSHGEATAQTPQQLGALRARLWTKYENNVNDYEALPV